MDKFSSANMSLKIAVVDDDEEIRELYSRIIVKLGYEAPTIFSDGTSLVSDLVGNHRSFDVIIMDYRMPEMNGIEAAKLILRFNKATRIVLATSHDSAKKEAEDVGIQYLEKPFSLKQLSECLSSVEISTPET